MRCASCSLSQSFNPRTHVGCDYSRVSRWYAQQRFNPRTHVGCDRCRCCSRDAVGGFNPRTHVGCDPLMFIHACSAIRFQSTHPRRVRPNKRGLISFTSEFQSTHPRRVRREEIYRCPKTSCFNPRTHVGCDPVLGNVSDKLVFQSTHPRRVRLDFPLTVFPCLMFQSTHPRRVRHSRGKRHSRDTVSIHAPT